MKSRRSNANVFLIDDAVKRIIEPDPEFFAKNKLDKFCSQFQLKENPKVKVLLFQFTILFHLFGNVFEVLGAEEQHTMSNLFALSSTDREGLQEILEGQTIII